LDDRVIRKTTDMLEGRIVSARELIKISKVRELYLESFGKYRPIRKGDDDDLKTQRHNATGMTIVADLRATVPGELSGRPVHFLAENCPFEGLLFVDDKPFHAIDRGRQTCLLSSRVKKGTAFDLKVEFRADPAEWRKAEPRFYLTNVSEVIHDWVITVRFARDTMLAVSQPWLKLALDEAIEEAVNLIDLALEGPELERNVAHSLETFKERLSKLPPHSAPGELWLIGHTHIDTAWLWPLKETDRKVARTVSSMLRLIEDYPDFVFHLSQPVVYQWLKDRYQHLFRQVKARVQEGRWEPVGAMWVEPDCNLPVGESLVRQCLYGQQFWQQEFGLRSRTCWLPDVFGFCASLPQILKKSGVDFFYSQKLWWQAKNPLPHEVFQWEGIDGTRIVSHVPPWPGYNSSVEPGPMITMWEAFASKGDGKLKMQPYGHGDGGGGPTVDMIKRARLARKFPGLPTCRMGHAPDFFHDLARQQREAPVWVGELYLETHRGVSTTQAALKFLNRRCEQTLCEAETFSSLANMLGAKVRIDQLAGVWKTVLTNQFHDILPGSGIGRVASDARASYTEALKTATAVRDQAARELAGLVEVKADSIVVLNSLAFGGCGEVSLPAGKTDIKSGIHLEDDEGKVVPVQVSESGAETALVFDASGVPPAGWKTFRILKGSAQGSSELRISEREIENAFLKATIDEAGEVSSLIYKPTGRETVQPGATCNALQLFHDGPEGEDAWNVHACSEGTLTPVRDVESIHVVEAGPARACLRIKRLFGNSRITQDMVLRPGSKALECRVTVDWREAMKMLKVAFHADALAREASFEIPFGAITRATHRNTKWEEERFEVSGHRWADIGEAGFGLAILNDSKYGYDALHNRLRLTLLRATTSPDPDADRGIHKFVYAMMPHAGDWRSAGVVEEAHRLNRPFVAVKLSENKGKLSGTKCFVKCDAPNVALEVLKQAEDNNGWILRVYETQGKRCDARIRLDLPVKRAEECDLLEDRASGVALQDGSLVLKIKPFEIRTFRIG